MNLVIISIFNYIYINETSFIKKIVIVLRQIIMKFFFKRWSPKRRGWSKEVFHVIQDEELRMR